MLRAEKLSKYYGRKRVVNEVSMFVNRGEIVGLLGPNGAGKTTTFYMIVGLLKSLKGNVLLDDKIINDIPMYMRSRLGIGYLSQEPSIFRNLSVRDNLMAILEFSNIPKDEKLKRADMLLSELGLTHLADQKSATLSGGEKRRCEIARTLVTQPSFLLLDEPFVGIDPIAVHDIQSIIAQLRDKGLGILITDHNVRETLEIIDRAYIVYEGRVLLEGTSKDLLSNSEARRVYLGQKFRM
ncbi:MAG: LPS export ABC transporter ATP-binding protein [bacterium]